MAANAIVRARIDETLKNEAADVLAGMGLTVSDLIRITLQEKRPYLRYAHSKRTYS